MHGFHSQLMCCRQVFQSVVNENSLLWRNPAAFDENFIDLFVGFDAARFATDDDRFEPVRKLMFVD